MEPLEFGKFIVQLITQFWDRCIIFTECNQGQAVIRKRFGRPIKWRTKPKWYWKWPFIDMFDKVDAYSGGYPFSISGDIRSVPS